MIFARDAPKKIANAPKKAPKKIACESPADGAYPRPVLVHPKLEKSRVKNFKRQKKQKVNRASEKKH